MESVQQTLCGTPEVVANVEVTDITSDSMVFRWNPPVNYNGNTSNPLYQVRII